MGKKAFRALKCIIISFAFCILLQSCGIIVLTDKEHEHSWKEATCTEARACTDCGKIDGEPLGHVWTEASCTAPKKCMRCGEEDGKPLGHFWKDASCTEPSICAVCGIIKPGSQPLGHSWVEPTFTEPRTCARCQETNGEPIPGWAFSRGKYDRWSGHPTADEYVGLAGYVAVTQNLDMYSTKLVPYDNDWFVTPWKATTYERDKQFFIATGTVEHKTKVVVIEQELEPWEKGTYTYGGYLLVERVDNGEKFYISVTDFVISPYWDNDNITDTLQAGPCLAEYHQISDYYPVDRQGNRVNLQDGETVFIFGETFWGGINSETNGIDALTSDGRCFFNADDLTIIY